MKTTTYITVEEARLYESIARQHNMSYSSPVPPLSSFLNSKKLKKKVDCKEEIKVEKLSNRSSNQKIHPTKKSG